MTQLVLETQLEAGNGVGLQLIIWGSYVPGFHMGYPGSYGEATPRQFYTWPRYNDDHPEWNRTYPPNDPLVGQQGGWAQNIAHKYI